MFPGQTGVMLRELRRPSFVVRTPPSEFGHPQREVKTLGSREKGSLLETDKDPLASVGDRPGDDHGWKLGQVRWRELEA